MQFVADRMDRIDASGIRKVFALAEKMTAPINLSIGQPDYDVDDVVKEAAIDSIRAGRNAYTQTWGIETLREACSEYYETRYGTRLENVMITAGVSGGLFLALMATVNPGDEVLFADPYFVMYKHLVSVLGGKAVPVNTYPDFQLTPEAIDAAITPKSKILIANSPSNPTGVAMSRESLGAIGRAADRHDLLVISDEIYDRFLYDGEPGSMAGRCENLVVLNGFSKTAAMTGWRVGFAAGPADIIGQMNTLQQYTFVCAPSMAQHAALTALHTDISGHLEDYRRKRDIIVEALEERFDLVRPSGAFYVFPKAPGGDGEAFVAKAIERNVLIIPGSVFSEENSHFRISFAAKDDDLRRGADVLNTLAGAMNG